jgi:hypothetical protein
MTAVNVINGTYRNQPINDVVFTLVKGYTEGKKGGFITVKSSGYFGDGTPDRIRIRVESIHDFEVTNRAPSNLVDSPETTIKGESDEDIMNRIEERFDILHEMTKAAINNDVRAMIVVGPPGVGKSYGVQKELEKSSMFDLIAERPLKYNIVKGMLTPIGLYSVLYKYSDEGNVIVFDDSDGIFGDELSLNLLKAALDSGKRRRICWNSESYHLRREGIPDSFDFKGSIIFITNLNMEHVKSKKLQDHLEALRSRCHYLDLTMNSTREKFLRIKQIHRTGDLFQDYDFDDEQADDIIEFMEQNKGSLREISLRMALKIADLTLVKPDNWRAYARATCMVN